MGCAVRRWASTVRPVECGSLLPRAMRVGSGGKPPHSTTRGTDVLYCKTCSFQTQTILVGEPIANRSRAVHERIAHESRVESPFSPCGRRWPGRPDEGWFMGVIRAPRRSETPSSAPSGHLLPQGEKACSRHRPLMSACNTIANRSSCSISSWSLWQAPSHGGLGVDRGGLPSRPAGPRAGDLTFREGRRPSNPASCPRRSSPERGPRPAPGPGGRRLSRGRRRTRGRRRCGGRRGRTEGPTPR